MSSAIVARHGRHSEITWPLSPCWANFRLVPCIALDERKPFVIHEGRWDDLTIELLQLRLGREQLELARPAGHEQEDDALGARGEMRRSGRKRVVRSAR